MPNQKIVDHSALAVVVKTFLRLLSWLFPGLPTLIDLVEEQLIGSMM
jgi:hypothetical protein